jgi:hydroxymethylglutaryl-CoA synthase
VSVPVGITAYGAYIPYWRLQRSAIGGSLGAGGGKGSRAVASYDEDTTSMGVEASRTALRDRDIRPDQLLLSTTAPAYVDKTNATAVAAALRLDERVLAADFGGAVRSGIAALLFGLAAAAAAAQTQTLVVLADTRTGLPASADEAGGGDAAAAFVTGAHTASTPLLAELRGSASASAEFLDRWRTPGAAASKVWEERFGEQAYVPLADEAFAAAIKDAEITPDQVDHLIVVGTHGRAVRTFTSRAGVRKEAIAPDRSESIGNPGTAQPGVVLADVLDRADPDETVVLVVLADGATATVWRTTPALPEHRAAVSVAGQIVAGNDSLPYPTFLTWKGFLDREPPRRPDPAAPAAPPSFRGTGWKYGFVASECTVCQTRHLPPARVCQHCFSVDEMRSVPLADAPATVATFTVDRLAYTPSPPMIGVVVDFDGGGRLDCELTDSDGTVAIGQRVEMTFRRVLTAANGVHNYFWKARPAGSAVTAAPAGAAEGN